MRDMIRLDIPVALVVLAFFLITAFQTEQLVREHNALLTLQAAQETGLAQAAKMRATFQTLVTETDKLAQVGDPAANAVLNQLKAQGVTLRSSAAASQP